MPGCDFTRRDLLRWSGVVAASPFLARTAFLSGLTATSDHRAPVPHPPPGRFLFSIALCNDLHMGETQAGLVGGIPQIKGSSKSPAYRHTRK